MFDRLVPEALADAAVEHLRQDGVERGAIVGWLGHNSWDLLATLTACERIGAVLLPLNWRLAAAELAQIVSHAGVGHLLGTPDAEALAADVLPRVRLQPGAAAGVARDDLLLLYTSGTTGRPRGAMHTRAGLQANAVAAIVAQGFDVSTRVLTVLPLFHTGGLNIQTLPALAAGGRVTLLPRFEPDAFFDAVEQQLPTTTLLVPAVMRALVRHPRWDGADLSSLKFINSGSQPVPRALIDAFHARGIPVAQVYGATETGPVSIVLSADDALQRSDAAGRPALGVQVRLAGDGEVLLKGANLMRGYHREGPGSVPSFDAGGWFHTGDLGERRDGGRYAIVGRLKDTIISGGENIHPAEIENLVSDLSGVVECAVVGVPDAQWGEVPVLAIVAGPGFDATALQPLLDARLARFKRPRRVVMLDALPKTALGKVQRAALAVHLMRDA